MGRREKPVITEPVGSLTLGGQIEEEKPTQETKKEQPEE